MISYCEFKQYLWIWWNVANTVVVRRCMSLSSAQALYTPNMWHAETNSPLQACQSNYRSGSCFLCDCSFNMWLCRRFYPAIEELAVHIACDGFMSKEKKLYKRFPKMRVPQKMDDLGTTKTAEPQPPMATSSLDLDQPAKESGLNPFLSDSKYVDTCWQHNSMNVF